MIDYNLINECLKCVPAFVGFFIVCLFLITICVCMLLLEKVFVSFNHRKNEDKVKDVKEILKEIKKNE